jgi:hypothetical protein
VQCLRLHVVLQESISSPEVIPYPSIVGLLVACRLVHAAAGTTSLLLLLLLLLLLTVKRCSSAAQASFE